jgi:hypothetical protein
MIRVLLICLLSVPALAQVGLRSPAFVAQLQRTAAAGGGGGATLTYSNNMVARWKPSAETGLSDNDPISTLTDFSTGGKNATAAGGVRPVYKANIVNGKAVARFDASDDKMGCSAIALTDFTVFIVFQTTGDNIILGEADFSTQFRVGVSGNDFLTVYDGSSQADSSVLGSTRSNWNLAVIKRGGSGEVFFWLNGVAKSSAFAFGALAPDTIGVSPINGDIAEIIVFSESMSDVNREANQAYVETEYGFDANP